MYCFVSILFLLIGLGFVLYPAFRFRENGKGRPSSGISYGSRLIGILFLAAGGVMLYLLLSGRITLPLSEKANLLDCYSAFVGF